VGDLTGSYIDTNGTIHGFLRPTATGVFTSFDDPNAGTSGSLNGTIGIAINTRTSGIEIAGSYLDTNSVFHGYNYSPALTATTTTLTPVPTPNPSIYQEPVTLTAAVTSSGGTPTNGDSVIFMSGSTSLGTAQMTSGTASLTTTDLPEGTDSITAAYSGDSSFAGSTSAADSQTVNKANSSTTLKSSLNPSTFGQSVTLTANISGQFSGVATGTVTFSNGASSLGSSSVSNNTATLATTTLPVGTDSITAAYSGDGNFTGSSSSALSQSVIAMGAGYQVRYRFCPNGGTCTDGLSPHAGLILDSAGNLYGTTIEGGANDGGGTVFKLDGSDNLTVLYNFCSSGSTCTDGAFPYSGLLQDAAGNLYGTTTAGGANNFNAGVVFKLAPPAQTGGAWTETVLHSFCAVASCMDGESPAYGALVQDAAGNLYGATTYGGSNSNSTCQNPNGGGTCGAVFKLEPPTQTGGAWTETVLYSFCSQSNCADGAQPFVGLTLDASGNLYGATELGGAHGEGTAFEVDNTGHFKQLYSFCSAASCADGAQPNGSLIQDAEGNLYGTASIAGAGNDGGTVFEISPPAQSGGAWTETTLYSLCTLATCADGDRPFAGGLVVDSTGNLFGTTLDGGNSNSRGTVFELSPPAQAGGTWNEKSLYDFCSATNCTDGAQPDAGLILDSAGNLYGTTSGGGDTDTYCGYAPPGEGCGTIFELPGASIGKVIVARVAVTPSALSITAAQSLSVTVAVSGGSGNPTPTGSVTLSGGSFTSAAQTLSNGGTAFVVPAGSLAIGTDTLTVHYTPDSASSSSYSGALGMASVTVTPATISTPTVIVTPSSSSVTVAQSLAVTVALSGGSGYPTATGTVTLTGGGYTSTPATLSGGTATFSIAAGALALGSDTLTASYTPDSASSSIYNSASGNISVAVTASTYTANEWIWMGGSSTAGSDCIGTGENGMYSFCGRPGVYGVIGSPAAANTPGGRYSELNWTDSAGNFWIFGGTGVDSVGAFGDLDDLWKFNPSTDEWTWVNGPNTAATCCGPAGVYGT
jgi:uncharacterized repeat protein (TIGR03803 family)